jgi:hypothetical protein
MPPNSQHSILPCGDGPALQRELQAILDASSKDGGLVCGVDFDAGPRYAHLVGRRVRVGVEVYRDPSVDWTARRFSKLLLDGSALRREGVIVYPILPAGVPDEK